MMASSERALRILITDGDNLIALGATRSLGRAGHYIVVGYPEGKPQPAAAFSRHCRARLTHPDPWGHQHEFRRWLIDQLSDGAYDVLLPVSEAAVVAAAAHRQELSQYAQLLIPPDAALRYTLSKYHSTQAAQECGLTIPKTVFLQENGQLTPDAGKLSSLQFPIIVKIDNYLGEDGCYVQGSNHSATNPDEAAAILELYRNVPTSIIAQEKISGYGVGGFVLRHQGRSILKFAHRRLHEYPYTGGISSLRAASSDPVVISAAERLLTAIDYEGVAMVELRQPAGGGAPHFLEINGRLWRSHALALHAGVDFPRAWLECQRSGSTSVVQPNYQEGLRCRDIVPGELLYLRSVLRAKPKAAEPEPPSKLGALLEFIALSLDPRVRTDTLWWSDPVPWLGTLYGTARLGLGKAWHRIVNARNRLLLWRARRYHQEHVRRAPCFTKPMSTILFLCTGNICRSPFAERYWNERIHRLWPSAPVALSAGFFEQAGRLPPPFCMVAARRFDVDLASHRSQVVNRDLIEAADAIFIMDAKNFRDMERTFPNALAKTWFLGLFGQAPAPELADPYLKGQSEAVKTYELMAQGLDGLCETMLECAKPREGELVRIRG